MAAQKAWLLIKDSYVECFQFVFLLYFRTGETPLWGLSPDTTAVKIREINEQIKKGETKNVSPFK
jgi:hypothetical protein